MHQMHRGSDSVTTQRGLHGRIAPTHDHDAPTGVTVRITQITSYMRKVLARHAQPPGVIGSSAGQHDGVGSVPALLARQGARGDAGAVVGLDGGERVDGQFEGGDVLAQVRQVLLAGQLLLVLRADAQATQRKPLGGGEEAGLWREGAGDRRADRAGVDHADVAALCQQDRRGLQADGPGSHDEDLTLDLTHEPTLPRT